MKQNDFVMLLDIKGKMYDSEELSALIENHMIDGKSEFVFIIGGSLGVSEQVKQRANAKISFSRMTFPHQLMRVIFLEQIYRSFKIMKNEPYHK